MKLDQDDTLFKALLKERRRAMGAGNRKKTKKISPTRTSWLYPFQYERKYFKYINKLMRQFTVPTTSELVNNLERWIDESRIDTELKTDELKQDEFINEWDSFIEDLGNVQENLFGENEGKGNRISFLNDLGHDVNEFNQAQWQKFMKIAIGQSFFIEEPWVNETINTWSQTNFELIKSLSDEYIKKVNTIVTNGVQTGALRSDIMREIRKTNKNISVTRSRLLSRDQVGKLNGILTQNRQVNAGIDMYTWLTAGDEKVRSSHNAINGKLCRWDNNRVYSKDGGKTWIPRPLSWPQTIPGNEIQCRCSAIPYFNGLIEQIDREIEAETQAA